MKQPKKMFDLLRSKGTALADLMSNPKFQRAVETAYRGKELLSGAFGQALKTMNVPSRAELKRAVARIDALERELADKRTPGAPARPKRRPAARSKKTPPADSGA